MIEKGSKQKYMLPNDVKLRVNVIDKLDKYFGMKKNKAISSVTNTIKYIYIQKNVHFFTNKTSIRKKKRKYMILLLNIFF